MSSFSTEHLVDTQLCGGSSHGGPEAALRGDRLEQRTTHSWGSGVQSEPLPVEPSGGACVGQTFCILPSVFSCPTPPGWMGQTIKRGRFCSSLSAPTNSGYPETSFLCPVEATRGPGRHSFLTCSQQGAPLWQTLGVLGAGLRFGASSLPPPYKLQIILEGRWDAWPDFSKVG